MNEQIVANGTTVSNKINGTASTSKTDNAQVGNLITITTNPASKWYKVGTITVTGETTPITATQVGGTNKYTFTMPASNVTVNVPFVIEYTYTKTASEITITGYTGSDTKLDISGKIDNIPVTKIGEVAFKNKTTVTGAIIPVGITSIGNSSFENTGLTKINIPNTVTSIGNYAFYMSKLTEINIPDNVTYLGRNAFSHMPTLTKATIGAVIKELPMNLFIRSNLSRGVTLPDTLEKIGQGSFNTTQLTSLDIPSSVTSIGGWVFENSRALKTIKIGYDKSQGTATVPTVGRGSFDNTALDNIFINKNYDDSNVSQMNTEKDRFSLAKDKVRWLYKVEGKYTFVMLAGNTKVNLTFKEVTYQIIKTTPINGDFTVPQTGVFGDVIEIIPTPNSEYETGVVTYNGHIVKPVAGKYTFTMPANDVTVNVTFLVRTQNFTSSITGTGTVVFKKATNHIIDKAQIGDIVTIEVTPEANKYRTKNLIVDGKNVTVTDENSKFIYTLTMPANDVEVTAEFVKRGYNITFSYRTNNADRPYDENKMGTVTMTNHDNVNPMTTQVFGGKLRVYVNNKAGYKFTNIKIVKDDGTTHYEQANPTAIAGGYYSIKDMPASNLTVNLIIEPIEYNLASAQVSAGGSITFEKEGTPITKATIDDVVTIKPVANPGYEIDTITAKTGNTNIVLTNGTGKEKSFIMPSGNVEVTVTYKKLDLSISINEQTDANGVVTSSNINGTATVTKVNGAPVTTGTPAKAQIGDIVTISTSPKDGTQLVQYQQQQVEQQHHR